MALSTFSFTSVFSFVFDLPFLSALTSALPEPILFSTQLGSAIELPNQNYILPTPIPMWPPVWWTWLVLLALVLMFFSIGGFCLYRYKKNAYRREAIALLNELQENSSNTSDATFLTVCHQTVRRCLLNCNRNDLAALPAHELFTTLDQTLKKRKQFNQLGELFITGAYQPNLQLTAQNRLEMLAITKFWCRRHHV